MNALQTQIRTFLIAATTLTASKPNEGTKTLAEWFALGNAELLTALLNDAAYGGANGFQSGQKTVDSNAIRAAYGSSPEYATISDSALMRIQGLLGNGVFDMSSPGLVAGMQATLTPYPIMLANFNALLLADASIAEAEFGGPVTQNDVEIAIVG